MAYDDKDGSQVLRITVHENKDSVNMTFEGRVAGPWVDELRGTWAETISKLDSRKVCLDLRDVTYADKKGLQALREIYGFTKPTILTGNLWTQYLAEQITNGNTEE